MGDRVREPVEARHVGRRHLERLVMLSDGVFAIAITLSAIELKPEAQPGESLLQAWATPLFVYFLSFLAIGQIWVVHRRIVAHLRDIDAIGTGINLFLLSLVALMPVVIRFALTTHTPGHEAMLVYVWGFAITFASIAAMWGYLAFIARLAPDVSRPLAWAWLLKKLVITGICVGVACYFAGWTIAAIVTGVTTIAARLTSWRLERNATGVSPAAP